MLPTTPPGDKQPGEEAALRSENGPAPRPRRGTSPRLSRTAVNMLVDAALLAVFLVLTFTAAVLRFIFPRATVAANWVLWGWGYDDWSQLHFVTFCAFLLGVLVHVMLNWTWICSVVVKRWPRKASKKASQPDDGIQTLYGVGTLIVIVNIVGLLLAAAALSIVAP